MIVIESIGFLTIFLLSNQSVFGYLMIEKAAGTKPAAFFSRLNTFKNAYFIRVS